MIPVKPDYSTCHNCGERLPFKPIEVYVKRGIRRYCSENCALKWHSKTLVNQSIKPVTKL